MDTKDDRRTIKTPLAVIASACAIGGFSAFVFGGIGAVVAWFGSCGLDVVIMVGIASSLAGAVLGASLAGLYALIRGSELGRGFTYPFTVYLGGSLGLVFGDFRGSFDARSQLELVWPIWIAGIVSGVVCGWVLAMFIRGYGLWARVGAAVGAIPMLLIGGFLAVMSGWLDTGIVPRPLVAVLFVVAAVEFALLGGSLGALVGAIIDRFTRRRVRPEPPPLPGEL